jgi:hypothetical protein
MKLRREDIHSTHMAQGAVVAIFENDEFSDPIRGGKYLDYLSCHQTHDARWSFFVRFCVVSR